MLSICYKSPSATMAFRDDVPLETGCEQHTFRTRVYPRCTHTRAGNGRSRRLHIKNHKVSSQEMWRKPVGLIYRLRRSHSTGFQSDETYSPRYLRNKLVYEKKIKKEAKEAESHPKLQKIHLSVYVSLSRTRLSIKPREISSQFVSTCGGWKET
jgi:hypothetical protein